jgi:hypothetical protein
MTQTRGLPTRAFPSAGGAIRHIERHHVVEALEAARLDFTPVDDLFALLRTRLHVVDAPAPTIRDHTETIEKASKAASKMLDALKDLPAEFVLEIESDIYQARGFVGPRPQSTDLFNFLVRLSELETKFDTLSPAETYRRTVADVFAAFAAHGLNLGSTEILRFMQAVESRFPRLAFPPETVESGRYNAIRRGRDMWKQDLPT